MESDEDLDPLFDQVVEHVVQSRRGSVSGVQRRFKIGYNRAARIVEQLEAQGSSVHRAIMATEKCWLLHHQENNELSFRRRSQNVQLLLNLSRK